MSDQFQQPVAGADGEDPQGPVVRDRRRLDPTTGQVRQQPAAAAEQPARPAPPEQSDGGAPAGQVGAEPAGGEASAADGEQLAAVQALADERLSDLQRLQAEYVNYRRRVDRDRDVARDGAVFGVLEALLPVLDDVHYARQHGDLTDGPFAAIAEKLETVLSRYGLQRYGEVGEPFDPAVHEALMHSHSADVTETTVVQVLQPGYRAGDKVLRAARVAVADPE